MNSSDFFIGKFGELDGAVFFLDEKECLLQRCDSFIPQEAGGFGNRRMRRLNIEIECHQSEP